MADKIDQIYAAIEDGQYERAIRLCQRKEISRLLLTKSLLSFALCRTRKHAEALQVAREVCACNPTDPAVLNALGYALRALGADNDLVAVYENAFGIHQTDEFAIELFQCYTRLNEHKKMQLLAQKMYKMTSNSRFVYWSVASMLFSMQAPNAKKEDKMQMMLAEKMLQKVISESEEQLGAEELRMYIDILVKQSKYTEALNSLNELVARPPGALIQNEDHFKEYPSSVKIHDIYLRETKLNILEKIGSYEDIKSCIYDIIKDYPDQWSSHYQIIDLIFKQKDQPPDWYLNECLGHHAYLVKQQESFPKLRGPYLAELYLLESLKKQDSFGTDVADLRFPTWSILNGPGDLVIPHDGNDAIFTTNCTNLNDYLQTKVFVDIAKRMCAYIDRFSAKPCCFADVKGRIEFVRGSTEHWFIILQALKTWCLKQKRSVYESMSNLIDNDNGEKRVELVQDMYRYNNFQYITIFCDHLYPSCEDTTQTVSEEANKLEDIKFLSRLFFKTKPMLAGGIGGDREVQPGDELLRVACIHLSVIGKSTRKPNDCHENIAQMFLETIKCVHLLSVGCTISPYNYAFIIDIIDPLRSLCAGELAMKWFAGLDVKHIQLDSMTYIIMPILIESGLFSDAHKHLKSLVTFVRSARRDAAECIAKCFSFNNYMSALEMNTFDNRLNLSLQNAVGRIELALLTLVDKCHTYVESEKYLQEYAIGAVVESQGFLSDEEVESLIDNADYNIIVRPNKTQADTEVALQIRRRQFIRRIKIGQLVLKLLSCATNGTEIESYITLLQNLISCDVNSDCDSEIEWSQNIACGESTMEKAVMNCFFAALKLSAQSKELMTNKNLENEENTSASSKNFIDLIRTLEDLLDLDNAVLASSDIVVVTNQTKSRGGGKKGSSSTNLPDQSIHFPLSPIWLKRMSYFTYSIATWVPILFGNVLNSVPKKATGKGGKGKGKGPKSGTDDQSSDTLMCLKSSCHSLMELMDKCSAILKSYERISNKNTVDQLELLMQDVKIRDEKESADEQMSKIMKDLISQISNSQETSCTSLGNLLSSKVGGMSILM